MRTTDDAFTTTDAGVDYEDKGQFWTTLISK